MDIGDAKHRGKYLHNPEVCGTLSLEAILDRCIRHCRGEPDRDSRCLLCNI